MKHKVNETSSSLGMILSIACAVHCLVMPLLLLAFPYLSDSFLHHPLLEWSILGILVVFGITSLNHYRKEHHNNNLPITLFTLGVALFLFALLLSGEIHHVLAIGGSLIIALSHGINLTLKKAVA